MKFNEACEMASDMDGWIGCRPCIHTCDEAGNPVDITVTLTPNDDGLCIMVHSPNWTPLTPEKQAMRVEKLMKQFFLSDDWCVE